MQENSYELHSGKWLAIIIIDLLSPNLIFDYRKYPRAIQVGQLFEEDQRD